MNKFLKSSIVNIVNFIKLYVSAGKSIDLKKPFKIVDYEVCDKKNSVKLYVQVYPTSNILYYSPATLIQDDDALICFSALDVRTIAFLAFRDLGLLKNHKYRIHKIYIKEGLGSQFIEYFDDSNVKFECEISSLASNKELLTGFSPLESYLIGYSQCEDSLLKESFYKKYAENV